MRPSHPNMVSAVRHVAGLLGIGPETRGHATFRGRAHLPGAATGGSRVPASQLSRRRRSCAVSASDLLAPEVNGLHAENYGVYGRRKMHALMRRQG